nr:hypothetical protein [Nostoc sp. DedQUE01]
MRFDVDFTESSDRYPQGNIWVWLHLHTTDILVIETFNAKYMYGAIAF